MNTTGTLREFAHLLLARGMNARAAIMGHHLNQKAFIHRAAEAKAWGLLPVDWMLSPKDWPTPFTQQNITMIGNGNGRWKKWLLILLLTLLCLGVPSAGYWYYSKTTTETVKHTETVLRGDADVEAGKATV